MQKINTLTPEQISRRQAEPSPGKNHDPYQRARARIQAAGYWNDNQFFSRQWSIGCVALEITQRCNLDCSLCYLSDHSEAVKDIPMEELYRRIDEIHRHYGQHTNVQITGGDPTLRNKDELLRIVRYVKQCGMRPTLMTNGIKASRQLLEELVDAGLVDIALHVDMTQQRKRNRDEYYPDEIALNAVRQQYIERVRGLPLSVIFNTTVHTENLAQIPAVVEFFRQNADVVNFASFQMQADSGRGTQRKRGAIVNQASVMAAVEKGAGTTLNFDNALIGHPRCNRYSFCLSVNGQLYDCLDDKTFVARTQTALAQLSWDRRRIKQSMVQFAQWLLRHPQHLPHLLHWSIGKAWKARKDLIKARGRVHKLGFFIHNFMDSCDLEDERLNSCIFHTMGQDGPMSMCLHNAKRDEIILKPIRLTSQGKTQYWQPLSGQITPNEVQQKDNPISYPLKRLKGRYRQQALQQRTQRTMESAP